MARATEEPDGTGYELLDAGIRRRLERFGRMTIERPAPTADGFRLAPEAWAGTNLRFDPGEGWSGPAASDGGAALDAPALSDGSAPPAEPWTVAVAGLTMELRPTTSGGLGLYPEHAANVAWLEAQTTARREATEAAAPSVLNLFAHTGLATLALARAGASVTHVDGARSAVAWARRNAELSGLEDRPIRWIVDDAAAFVAREARRGRRYDGIVLDPPAFGRAGNREWRLEEDLPSLLDGCRNVAAEGAFVLLTAHSESIDGTDLREMLATAFRAPKRSIEITPLGLTATSGAHLALGWAARAGA